MNRVDDNSASARARLMKSRCGTWVDESLFPEARRECLEIIEQVARETENSGIVEMLRGERKYLGDTELGERLIWWDEFCSRHGLYSSHRHYDWEAMRLFAERAHEYELPEEHDAQMLASRVLDRADACGTCGRSLSSGEPAHFGTEVYVGFIPARFRHASPLVCQPRYLRTVLCGTCSPNWLSPDREGVVAQLCARCERPMVYRLMASTMRWTFCSEACGRAYHGQLRNQLRKERGAAEREKVCEICGRAFTASRKDTKSCSPGCKQKAYRQRKREAR